MAEETIVPFRPSRDAVPPLVGVRSTLIGSSLLSLRAHGLEARYLEHLDPAHKETILYTPAGVWLPTAVALAHYTACDRLGLDVATILAIGNEVAKATQKSVLAMILRLAKEAGTTPWTLFASCDRYWARIFDGSGIGIFKVGPKDARFEVASCALARSPYWRTGLRGLLTAVSEPFALKVYVREISHMATEKTCGLKISWA